MNQVRLHILRTMWKDQKLEMMKNLRLGKRKDKKLRNKRLLNIPDELKEQCIRQYYHMCKEKAATEFIEWRMYQAELLQNPEMKKILRTHRLQNSRKLDLEQLIFEKYRMAYDKTKVLPKLVELELKIQETRKVAVW